MPRHLADGLRSFGILYSNGSYIDRGRSRIYAQALPYTSDHHRPRSASSTCRGARGRSGCDGQVARPSTIVSLSLRGQTLKTRGELVGIQILRAVAAILVVAHHAIENSNGAIGQFSPDWLTTAGAAGVDIFFVISGFIMLYTSFDKSGSARSPREFLYRRLTRIYPFYWICCVVMLLIGTAGFLHSHSHSITSIALSLALLPTSQSLIGVSWTLVYELYFYLLFAAALLTRSKIAVAAIVTIAIALINLGARMVPVHNTLQSFLANPIPYEFCMGIWLAWAAEKWLPRLPIWTMLLPLLMFGAAPLFVVHHDTTGLPDIARVIAWGVPAAILVAIFLNTPSANGRITIFLEELGNSSYALYLTHPFVMIAYASILKRSHRISAMPQEPFVISIVAISIALSIIAHRLAEIPLNRTIKRISGRYASSSIRVASRNSV